jgi:hypothetical protein
MNAGLNNTFQATLTGLINGDTYVIGVRAYNSYGEEQNTITVSCVADAVGPGPVVNLTSFLV